MNFHLQTELEKLLQKPDFTEDWLAEKVADALARHDQNTHVQHAVKTMDELLNEGFERIENNVYANQLIKTGFQALDEALGGLVLGEFCVIGGRPGMGKTLLMTHMALQISTLHPVMFFSFDLSSTSLSARIISSLSAIPLESLLHGKLSSEEQNRLAQARKALGKHKLFINHTAMTSATKFVELCEEHIAQHGVKVIFIDYLQMMRFSHTKRQLREQDLANICRILKQLAQKHNVVVVTTSQLSRAVETRGGDRRPQLSDLRESGAIEQDADKVIFIYRPAYYGILQDEYGRNSEQEMELLVVKNRIGKQGTVKLQTDAELTGFLNSEPLNDNFLDGIKSHWLGLDKYDID